MELVRAGSRVRFHRPGDVMEHESIDLEKTHTGTWSRVWMALLWGLIAASVVSAVILGFGLLSEEAAFSFSSIVYVPIPVGVGVAVMAAAWTLRGRERVAWMLIGAGALCWGLGEVIWVLYEYVFTVEVPYPGWADVFYVGGYPVMFAGILVLPHVKPRRLERLRLSIDALAGTVAVTAIMWVTYLKDQIYLDPEIGFFEQAVNILYPLADVMLLVAVVILTTRRSVRRFDARLLALAAALIISAVADLIFIFQLEADTYVSGNWLDSLWLLDYAFMALAAWFILRPSTEREQADRQTRIWQMAAPYTAVAVLFGLTIWDIGASGSVLQISTVVVGGLVIVRQGVAIKENRELVEHQRDNLIKSISHELRTPMTSVTGYTAVLADQWEGIDRAEAGGMVTIVNEQAQLVNRIVTDLVDLARGTLDFPHLETEPCDLTKLILDAKTMVGNQLDGTTTIDTQLEPDLWVNGDQQRLTQVIINLLTNAVRYGNGNILVDTSEESGHVTVEIHDNGPGIPKRYEETIWDRFERGPHRYDAAIPGSGIGLPIARALTKAHGGTLTHQSSSHLGGACFVLSLPATTAPTPNPNDTTTSIPSLVN